MTEIQNFAELGFLTLTLIALCSFVAGFIDAVVGGGGLIQLPAALILFPQISVPSIFGTNKIAALSGTSVSAIAYAKKIKFDFIVLVVIAIASFVASFFGAKTMSYVNPNALKPFILLILIGLAIFTFIKKDLGEATNKNLSQTKQIFYGVCLAIVVGFYDGFIGPGTGSFFALGFVMILGYEFLKASAYAKVINCVTNIAAIAVFIKQGNYILELAIVMAVCNVLGNIVGTKIALKKGNAFIRKIFLIIVVLLIVRYSYDIFIK